MRDQLIEILLEETARDPDLMASCYMELHPTADYDSVHDLAMEVRREYEKSQGS